MYVVFSGVKTLSGLYLCEKLDEHKEFTCDASLLREEEHLSQLETDFLKFVAFKHWC
jgi:hypothetical protein